MKLQDQSRFATTPEKNYPRKQGDLDRFFQVFLEVVFRIAACMTNYISTDMVYNKEQYDYCFFSVCHLFTLGVHKTWTDSHRQWTDMGSDYCRSRFGNLLFILFSRILLLCCVFKTILDWIALIQIHNIRYTKCEKANQFT